MSNQNSLSCKNILREGGLSQDILKWRKIRELVTSISYLKIMTKGNSLYRNKIIKNNHM